MQEPLEVCHYPGYSQFVFKTCDHHGRRGGALYLVEGQGVTFHQDPDNGNLAIRDADGKMAIMEYQETDGDHIEHKILQTSTGCWINGPLPESQYLYSVKFAPADEFEAKAREEPQPGDKEVGDDEEDEEDDEVEEEEDPDVVDCAEAGESIIRQMDKAREELDELHGAIEEYKDPTELARVAKVFTTTPLTTEAQFKYIQDRLLRIHSTLSTLRLTVDGWTYRRACKRAHPAPVVKEEEEEQQQPKKNKKGVRYCDECHRKVDEESPMHSTPQWAVCMRCVTGPSVQSSDETCPKE